MCCPICAHLEDPTKPPNENWTVCHDEQNAWYIKLEFERVQDVEEMVMFQHLRVRRCLRACSRPISMSSPTRSQDLVDDVQTILLDVQSSPVTLPCLSSFERISLAPLSIFSIVQLVPPRAQRIPPLVLSDIPRSDPLPDLSGRHRSYPGMQSRRLASRRITIPSPTTRIKL